jgi:subtilisin family serine protease
MRNIKGKLITVTGALALVWQGSPALGQAPRYVEGELLVKFKGGARGEAARRVKSAHRHTVKRDFEHVGWQHVQLPLGLTVEETVARYQNDPDVLAVEPNYVMQIIEPVPAPASTAGTKGRAPKGAGEVTPNDPLYTSQWGLARMHAPQAWTVTTGSTNVVMAVMASGINYNHEDLRANMWRNPGEIPGNGIDDDGDGYVDDLYGIDVASNDADPWDEGTSTSGYFGSAAAGIIGAVGNNGQGLAGVNWSVQLMGIRYFRTDGTSTEASFIEGVNYLVGMKSRGVNLRAVHMAFGGTASQSRQDAVDALRRAGVLAVCSATNNGQDSDQTPRYPASYDLPNIIAVAASDQNDNLTAISNWGRTNVDLAAPGIDLYSTFGPGNTAYDTVIGAGMAAAQVAGAVALLAAANPNATAAEIKAAILETVDVVPALTNKMVSNGRLNVARALVAILSDLLRITAVTNGPPLAVSFQSSSNRLYTLVCCTNLAEAVWTPVPSQTDIPGTGSTLMLQDPDPSPGTVRCYRVSVRLP